MRGESVHIADLVFSTKKAAEDYVRKLLVEIGFCSSVKARGHDYFDVLLAVASRHPNHTEKLIDVVDFSVQRNVMNPKAYELYVLNSNGKRTDISWRICVSGKPKSTKTDLYSAMRYSVEDHIAAYRHDCITLHCALCASSIADCMYHVDHVVHFEKLVIDFLNAQPKASVPSEFMECKDGTNRYVFKAEDQAFSDAFYMYHKEHAMLRKVCPKCNMTRPKHCTSHILQ